MNFSHLRRHHQPPPAAPRQHRAISGFPFCAFASIALWCHFSVTFFPSDFQLGLLAIGYRHAKDILSTSSQASSWLFFGPPLRSINLSPFPPHACSLNKIARSRHWKTCCNCVYMPMWPLPVWQSQSLWFPRGIFIWLKHSFGISMLEEKTGWDIGQSQRYFHKQKTCIRYFRGTRR